MLERDDGRRPLVLLVATDSSGRLIELAACDAEDYD